eukprot:4168055-Alexandrium_andersonii.AAC.1
MPPMRALASARWEAPVHPYTLYSSMGNPAPESHKSALSRPMSLYARRPSGSPARGANFRLFLARAATPPAGFK